MVEPGINPMVGLDRFDNEVQRLVTLFSIDWYVTYAYKDLMVNGRSKHHYMLIKPTKIFSEMFNIEREIIMVVSPHERFEPRSFEAFEQAALSLDRHRVEKICNVLVSKDVEIENKVMDCLKDDKEALVVIPFSFKELLLLQDDAVGKFVQNRFRKHFFKRDLFACETPLKKGLYFFGRDPLVHDLISRHKSEQLSGLFGLRRSGKTSVVFAIKRALQRTEDTSVFIDCQSPAFHQLRWNHALHYVISEIISQNDLNVPNKERTLYTVEDASKIFEVMIQRISGRLGNNRILLIFDEVENISFEISPSIHWEKENDFIYFWQTMRSAFQKLNKIFTFLIVGTNPICVEQETINGKDNPMFGQLQPIYLSRFDVPQTKEMVGSIGKIMGLNFDENVFSQLNEDFGGHPFLIRHACSTINSTSRGEYPRRIDKSLYEEAKNIFVKYDGHKYFNMILNVLRDHFNDEYEMLILLARGDHDNFYYFANNSPLYTKHLVGYGLIEEVCGKYVFRSEALEEYLQTKDKYKKMTMTQDEKIAEISERRNRMEKELRNVCCRAMLYKYGEQVSISNILNIFGEPRKTKYTGLRLKELFETRKVEIYFEDLRKIISKHWDAFANIFGKDKDKLMLYMKHINEFRFDAHATEVKDDEFVFFRLAATYIEDVLKQL